MALNVKAAMTLIREAEKEALDALGEYTVAIARAKAPVRHLGGAKGKLVYSSELGGTAESPGGGGFIRISKRGQTRQPLRVGTESRYGFRSKIGAVRLNERYMGHTTFTYKGRASSRSISRTDTGVGLPPSLLMQMNAQGRYEARRGRALNLRPIKVRKGGSIIQIGTAVEIGGRLKNSIVSSGAAPHGSGFLVNISADPVDENGHHYAKYVEFPTSHNAAQPFLRPALKSAQRKVKQEFEGRFRAASLKR